MGAAVVSIAIWMVVFGLSIAPLFGESALTGLACLDTDRLLAAVPVPAFVPALPFAGKVTYAATV